MLKYYERFHSFMYESGYNGGWRGVQTMARGPTVALMLFDNEQAVHNAII